jgi:hypothetical protein
MVLDSVASVNDAGASLRTPTKIDGPHQTETMVQYRQTIGGIPVITPGVGTIQVTVDNEGKATSISTSTRRVDDLTSYSPNAASVEPTPPGREPSTGGEPDINRLLARSLSDRLRRMSHQGDLPAGITVVPGTTEIGYDVQGDHAVLVAQRSVELDFGGLYKKRYLIKAPLNG